VHLFSKGYLERTSMLSMLVLKQSWNGRSTEKSSWVCMCEDKVCTKDMYWSVGMAYDSRGLPEVITVGPG
jgi:hypothetical protein